jgi:hypothetical protein
MTFEVLRPPATVVLIAERSWHYGLSCRLEMSCQKHHSDAAAA